MSLNTGSCSADTNDFMKSSQTGSTTKSGLGVPKKITDYADKMDLGDICCCGPCQRFWQEVLRNSYLAQAKEEGSLAVKSHGKVQHHQNLLSVGDRVMVQGKPGSVKFVDFVDDSVVAPVLRVGVRLDESIAEGHDGVYQGKRYFHCTDGHGIFAPVADVVPLPVANRRPPVRGNPMFPSWTSVCKKRKDQEALTEKRQERERKAAVKIHRMRKQPQPPSISPRENLVYQQRRDFICLGKMPVYHTARADPCDMVVMDQQRKQHKKGEPPVTSSGGSAGSVWDQWQKYEDPEKVRRMEETFRRLCSAYREGAKFKHYNEA